SRADAGTPLIRPPGKAGGHLLPQGEKVGAYWLAVALFERTKTMLDERVGFDVTADNERRRAALQSDYSALGEKLGRSGVDIDRLKARAAAFAVAVPSWGVGTGGTRFARYPGAGEPRNIFDKLDDCAVIHALTGVTPRVSLHIPWDKVSDISALKEKAAALGLGFDAMNSNTFQDSPGQKLSYKFGSLSHTDRAVRMQAIEHNLECIHFGRAIGSKALTIWIGDGSN